jgi:hypothetical protein
MDQMLDAGFWILDFKRKLSLFFQHPASSIQHLVNCGINDRFHDVVIFGSGLAGLCYYFAGFSIEFFPLFRNDKSDRYASHF